MSIFDRCTCHERPIKCPRCCLASWGIPGDLPDDNSRMTNPLAVIGGITTTYLHDERTAK